MAGAFLSGLLVMVVALFWPADGKRPVPAVSPFAGPAPQFPSGKPENAVTTSPGPRLAIVVGDLGYDPVRDAEWLDFPEKITLSVLPFGPSSRTVGETAAARGHSVILHVPMEPLSLSADRTEPFRLRREMEAKEIAERLARMAQDVPQAVGTVNHMGSAFTTDPAAMDAFMAALKGRGFFFVDSATAAGSLGVEAARKAGVPAVQRDVFLDGDPGPDEMRRQWGKAIALAKQRGEAVLLCHSRRETRKALLEMIPDLRKEGVRPVTVQELLAEPRNG
jgi:polysaccharide deacetylase 2 family uncharacterized protein YibQ